MTESNTRKPGNFGPWALVLALSLTACGGDSNPADTPGAGSPALDPLAGVDSVGSDLARNQTPKIDVQQVREVVRNNFFLGWDWYLNARASAAVGNGNFVLSPYGLGATMNLIYPGLGQAVETGDPQTSKPTPDSTQEFIDTLRFAPITNYLGAGYNFLDLQLAQHSAVAIKGGDPSAVTSIHSLWLAKGASILSGYLDGLATDHGARIFLMPEATLGAGADQARDAMNLWASASSNDKVSQLVASGEVDGSKMMLLDATAFSGLWSLPFESNRTIDADFTANGSAGVTTKKFLVDDRTVLYLRAPSYQAIELEYRGGFFVVDFILPDEGKLNEAEDELIAAQDVDLMRNAAARFVSIQLPRFSVQSDWLMAETLRQLGMSAIFDETKADFSKLIADGTVAPKNIKQRASFAIDEKGSSAEGDTSGFTHAPGVPAINVRFDHPFFFVVKDKSTDTVVLMGRVLDPQQ